MHTVTLHGVGVIAKLYFAIFGDISGINDLESRAEVIQGHTFCRQSKARIRHVHVYRPTCI